MVPWSLNNAGRDLEIGFFEPYQTSWFGAYRTGREQVGTGEDFFLFLSYSYCSHMTCFERRAALDFKR